MDLTLKLISPVTVNGETFSDLTLHELVVDENIELEKAGIDRSAIEQDKYFFAKSCNVPPAAIGALKQRDWTRLKNLYWATLGNVEPEPKTAAS